MAAYRDDNCPNTLYSLYTNSTLRDKVFVGLVQQRDMKEGKLETNLRFFAQTDYSRRRRLHGLVLQKIWSRLPKGPRTGHGH